MADIPSQDIGPVRFKVSVPGRTELAGNHQDHQGGLVVASAIDRRISCDVRLVPGTRIFIESEGAEPFELDFTEEDFGIPHIDEANTTRSLVRGMASQIAQQGIALQGCKLSFTSDIPQGAGLSSSAAFELCAGAALLAAAGSFKDVAMDALVGMALVAEREFFGKPCGIMDQTTCGFGGTLLMDFRNRANPSISSIELPSTWDEYDYYLVNCGHGHEDATGDFAQVALDMQDIAHLLGIEELRDISQDAYLERVAYVREELGDRAALRGFGFFEELRLVEARVAALKLGDMDAFVHHTDRSGMVSEECLQNVGIPGKREAAMVALALCRHELAYLARETGCPQGSVRIHGGGFGGTIQVIVPHAAARFFRDRIDALLGEGSCMEVCLGAPGVLVEEVS